MVSVTPDTALNNSRLPAPSRTASAERSPAPDSFASLIDDSGADTAASDRASAAKDLPAPKRSADDAGSDSRRPRDLTASRAPADNPADDDGAAVRSGQADGADDAKEACEPAGSGEKKPGVAALDTKAKDATGVDNATDQAAASAIDGLSVAAAAVVATAIPTAIAPIGITAGSGSLVAAQAPLAIAAAALANSSEIGGLPSAPASSVNQPSDAAPALSEVEAAANETADLEVHAQGDAGKADAPSVAQPAAPAAVIATTDQLAVGAAIAASAPKTDLKEIATAQSKPGTDNTGFQPSGADPATPIQSANKPANAEPSSANGKSVPAGAIPAAKPQRSNADAPIQFSDSPHDHAAASATGPAQPDLSASGIQAANNLQPQASNIPAADQLTAIVATPAAVPLNALALQIAATAQSGKSRFEIRLDPAELGRIDVRIDIDRQGQVTSHLTVEKPETLAMLRQDAPQLQRALDDAGFKAGDSGLQFSLRDQSSSGQNSGNESGRQGHRLIISNDDTVSATTAGRTYGRMLASSGGLDIMV